MVMTNLGFVKKGKMSNLIATNEKLKIEKLIQNELKKLSDRYGMYKKIAIVTGSAGFIGFHMSKRLLEEGWKVVGIDNLNSFYDISLKSKRHELLKQIIF